MMTLTERLERRDAEWAAAEHEYLEFRNEARLAIIRAIRDMETENHDPGDEDRR